MSKKHTFEYIKDFIEKEGYILLSTEYLNAHEKLLIQCPEKHVYEVKFNNFQQGQRCLHCTNKNKKLPINYITEYLHKFNYTLKSEYKNENIKIKLECPEKHIFETTFHRFKHGKQRCPVCANNIKHTFEYVKNFIEQENYTLISTEYLNAHEKIEMLCDKSHNISISFANFQQGKRCSYCSLRNVISKPEKEIVDYVKTIYNGLVVENDRTLIKNPLTGKMLELDIYLPEINKAIEFNGSYWHDNNYVKFKDKIKLKQCKEKSINLLVINESEWIENKNWNYINSFVNT
jgi:hypothetical protein